MDVHTHNNWTILILSFNLHNYLPSDFLPLYFPINNANPPKRIMHAFQNLSWIMRSDQERILA
jgi:hypothetical protein